MSQIVDMQHLTEEQKKFLSKVIKDENGCWIWKSSKNKTTGYGMAVSNRKMFIAHRLSYTLFRGAIPIGLVVHHVCHIKLCVNPDHLEAITQKENLSQSDGLFSNSRSAHNSKKTNCPKGHEYTEKTENGKKRRYCLICREANNIRKNNKFAHIDPIIIAHNIKRFEQRKLLGVENDIDLKQFIVESRDAYGKGAFDSALRLLLAQNGVLTYGASVERARRSILKALTFKKMNLEEMGVVAGFKIPKTNNPRKPVPVIQEPSK